MREINEKTSNYNHLNLILDTIIDKGGNDKIAIKQLSELLNSERLFLSKKIDIVKESNIRFLFIPLLIDLLIMVYGVLAGGNILILVNVIIAILITSCICISELRNKSEIKLVKRKLQSIKELEARIENLQ